MIEAHKLRLRECVLQTLRPNLEEKREGEKVLDQMSVEAGFLETLLQMALAEADPPLRTVASIYFRRYLEKFWKKSSFNKEAYMYHLPQYIATAPEDSQRQLLSTLKYILDTESTETWTHVTRASSDFIRSEDPKKVEAGLKIINLTLKVLCAGFKSDEVIEGFFDHTGLVLLDLLKRSLIGGKTDLGAYILKIFAKSIENYVIPNAFKDFTMFREVLGISISALSISGSNWSLIKWSLFYCITALKKASKKKYFDDQQIALFVQRTEVYLPIYQRLIELLTYHVKNPYEVPDKVVRHAYLLMCTVTESKVGWEVFKNDISIFTSTFILPMAVFTELEEELWNDNPINFIKEKNNNYLDDTFSSAANLFYEITRKRKECPEIIKEAYNVLILSMIDFINDPSEEKAKVKYGALGLIGATCKHMDAAPSFLDVYVIPDLNSPYPFLRYRAFTTLQSFGDREELREDLLNPVLLGIQSPSVPIKVEALLTLPYLLTIPSVRQTVTPSLPEIINILLTLTNRIQIEMLSNTLEDIIRICDKETVEMAPSIANAMASSVLQILTEISKEDEDNYDEDRIDVVSGYIRTIGSLVEALGDNREMVRVILQYSRPMILTILKSYSDVIFEVLELLVSSIYMIKDVSGFMDIFESLLRLSEDDVIAYSREYSNVLDNFISYGGPLIIPYTDDIFRMLGYISPEDQFSDIDHISTCRILESLVLNIGRGVREKDQRFYSKVIDMALRSREEIQEVSPVVFSLEVLMNAFVQCPEDVVAIMNYMNLNSYVIDQCIDKYKRFERVHDKKILLLFSTVIMSFPLQSVPKEFTPEKIAKLFHYALTTLPDAIAYRNKLRSTVEEEEEYYDDYYDENELKEDPSFETPLDSFEPFDYAKRVLSQQSSGYFVGEVTKALTKKQWGQIAAVLT